MPWDRLAPDVMEQIYESMNATSIARLRSTTTGFRNFDAQLQGRARQSRNDKLAQPVAIGQALMWVRQSPGRQMTVKLEMRSGEVKRFVVLHDQHGVTASVDWRDISVSDLMTKLRRLSTNNTFEIRLLQDNDGGFVIQTVFPVRKVAMMFTDDDERVAGPHMNILPSLLTP